ncbi:multidrug/spermidine efflux SMR transporter subunit MdtI [Escherichia coli]
MAQFEWVHAAWLALAIVLEIVANVFLKFSDGFRRKIFGLLSLAAVLAAFSALSQAVKGIDLSVAYALWGGFGIAATGNDSNLLIVFYVQIMPDDFVMQLHRF